jgi:hypothetical protein
MASFFAAVGDFLRALPSWVRALMVLAVGSGSAFLLRFLCWKLLPPIRFDALCARIGISEFLRKGGVGRPPSRLVGTFAWGVVLIVTFFQVSRQLDIGVVNAFSGEVAASVPRILASFFIVIIGLVVVSFVGNFVLTVALNAARPHASLLARGVKIAGIVLVLSLALEQLNLSRSLLTSLFQILFAAAAFGTALAFGLGCKDIARDAMLRFLRNLREKERAEKGSDLEG